MSGNTDKVIESERFDTSIEDMRPLIEYSGKNEFNNFKFCRIIENTRVGQALLVIEADRQNPSSENYLLYLKFLDHNGDCIASNLTARLKAFNLTFSQTQMLLGAIPEILIKKVIDEALNWSMRQDTDLGLNLKRAFIMQVKDELGIENINEDAYEQLLFTAMIQDLKGSNPFINSEKFGERMVDFKKELFKIVAGFKRGKCDNDNCDRCKEKEISH